MALHLSRGWLIAYDIADPRRLGRLHAFVKKHALPVQYSLYYCEASPARMDALMRRIEKYIDPRHDDVRAYQVPANPRIFSLGRGALPDGAALLSASDSLGYFGKPLSPR